MLALAPVLLWSGCSSAPEAKVEKKAPEPVTGLHALYQMYTSARTWAQDLKIVRMVSISIPQVKATPGKAAAWQVIFASESLGRKRAYTFSTAEVSATMHAGISPDAPSAWSSDNRAFLLAAAKVDTDVVWETALKHAADYAKKNPDMPISYTLEMGRNINDPVWRVIWGESAASSGFSVLVDASTGAYLDTLH